MFEKVCAAHGLPQPTPEYRFAPPRRWRFDYAWPADVLIAHGVSCARGGIAIEVEGGAFTRGRHTRGAGFVKDMEKYNAAALAGWKVLRVTPGQLLTHGPDLLRKALQ